MEIALKRKETSIFRKESFLIKVVKVLFDGMPLLNHEAQLNKLQLCRGTKGQPAPLTKQNLKAFSLCKITIKFSDVGFNQGDGNRHRIFATGTKYSFKAKIWMLLLTRHVLI